MQSKSYEKVQLLKESTTGTIIKVKNPLMESGGNFTSYMVAGTDKLGAFQIRRRFNEFFLLRDGLVKAWPGLYVPPIPSKKMTGNKEDKFVDDRKRFLEYFCQQVSRVSYLYYSEIFQQFLRNKSVVLETMVENIEKLPTSDRLTLYKELFGDMDPSKEPIMEYKMKISTFNTYLKKSEKELDGLKDRIQDIAYAVRVFNNSFNICNTLIFPEYEKNVFSLYVEEDLKELPFLNDNMLGERVRLFRDTSETNALDYIVDTIVFEHREVISLQESIQLKEDLQQKKKKLEQKKTTEQNQLTKLMSGKTTFKSIFSRGSKNDQMGTLQKSVQDDTKEIESLNVLLNYITIILCRQIARYKAEKQMQYVDMLEKVANLESEKLCVYGDLIKSVSMAAREIKIQ